MVDYGLWDRFADERFPNVDIFLPDPKFGWKRIKRILPVWWLPMRMKIMSALFFICGPALCRPIYCTKFTAAVLRAKFHDFPELQGMQNYRGGL